MTAPLFILSLSILAQTMEPNISKFERFDGYSLGHIFVYRDQNLSHDIRVQIDGAVERMRGSRIPLFEAMNSVDLLFDETWALGSGYWNSNLVSTNARPAILLRQSDLYADKFAGAFVHELTHHLHHLHRPKEVSWMREGLALVMEKVINDKFHPSIRIAYEIPESSLVADLDPRDHHALKSEKERQSQYGHLSLFFYYAYRLCGEDSLLSMLLTHPSKQTGVEFFNESLSAMASPEPVCRDFPTLFKAFQRARLAPTYSRDSNFVVIHRMNAMVREIPTTLPPYAAGLYKPQERNKCVENDVMIDQERCLQLRLE